MEFDGSVQISAPHEKVWLFLCDAHAVSQCAPGVKSVEIIIPEKQFKLVAARHAKSPLHARQVDRRPAYSEAPS